MNCTRGVVLPCFRTFRPTPQPKIISSQMNLINFQVPLKNFGLGLSHMRGISFSVPVKMQISSQKTDQVIKETPIMNNESNSFDQQVQQMLSQNPPRTLEVSNQIDKSLDNGLSPSISTQNFESLTYRLAIQKHTETIQTLITKLEHINSPLLTPTAYACVVISLLLGGRYESAQQLYEDYVIRKNIQFDLPSSNLLIKMFGMRSQIGSAVQVFRTMKKNGVKPDVDTYNNLTYIFSRKGSPAKVTECVEKMKAAGIQPNQDTFKHLVSHYAFRKNISQATKYLQEYIQYDAELNQISPSVVGAFNSILVMHARSGDTTAMIKLYDEIKQQGYIPNRSTFTILLMSILHRKELQQAIKFYFIMKGYGYPTTDMVKHFHRAFKRDTQVSADVLELWHSILPSKHSLVNTSITVEDLKKFEDSLSALQQ